MRHYPPQINNITIDVLHPTRIRLTFPERPDETTRNALKAMGFVWSGKKKQWVTRTFNETNGELLLDVLSNASIYDGPRKTKSSVSREEPEIWEPNAEQRAFIENALKRERGE